MELDSQDAERSGGLTCGLRRMLTYVSQLLGERREVTVDKAVSTGVTLFDRKGATMSHKTTMRPLMRPDELGSMNETRCIIKLRNQQPIFGVRNFYYADNELLKRAWLQLRALKSQHITNETSSFPIAIAEKIQPSDIPPPAGTTPGGRFAAKSLAVMIVPSRRSNSQQVQLLANASYKSQQANERSSVNSVGSRPDFTSAMKRSAERKADADKSLEKVLTIFENAPAKKRTARKAKKEIASALSDE